MTKEQASLNSLLVYWQDILHLSHWSILVRPIKGFEDSEQRGDLVYSNPEKSAVIQLLSSRSLSKLKKKEPLYTTETQESILVHELLHLLTQNVKEGEESEETLINSLTRSLINLKGKTSGNL